MNLKAKLFGIAAAVALFVGVAVPANALTSAEAEVLISVLGLSGSQADAVRALVDGGTTSEATTSCTVYTRDLTIGSTGSDVVALQTFLENGYLVIPAGVSKGYFGELTRSALSNYQNAMGISPAVGYFGPITRSSIKCEATTPTTPTTPGTSLQGEGDIEVDVTLDSDVDLDLGETEEVIVLDFEAVDGDVELDRVDFMFDVRPWLYFDEVVLEIDGDEVGSLSGSGDFSEVSGEYRARFSGLDTVIMEDDTAELTLIVTVLNSMSGDRDLDTVTVSFDPDADVRFMDASGAVLFGATGDTAAVEVTFTDDFGQGGTSVTLGNNSPEDATIVLDVDSRTNGVEVLEFDVEAEDDDIEIQDVTVTFATSGVDVETVADTVYRAYLYQDGDLLASQSVSGNSVTFDDIEFAIDEDDEETFTIEVDFNKAEGLTVDGFTVVDVDVVFEDSDFVEDTETLTVNEDHTLVVEGLVETFTKKSSKTTNLGTTQTNAIFTFEFELTAVEDDFYINEDGSTFGITLDNASTSVVATTIASTNATLTNDDSYRINEGQTRTFTVEVEVESTSGSQSVRATIDDVDYDTASTLDDVSATLLLGAPDYRSTATTVFVEAI